MKTFEEKVLAALETLEESVPRSVGERLRRRGLPGIKKKFKSRNKGGMAKVDKLNPNGITPRKRGDYDPK